MSTWFSKRFWKDATVEENSGHYVIHLDGHIVKTPAKATLKLPNKEMAQVIADEWQSQGEKIHPESMPNTRSANAAIDKVEHQKAEVVAMIAAYGEDDLLCYRAPDPKELKARQSDAWDPILAWAAKEFDAPLITIEGVMHETQPANSITNLTAQVSGQTEFQLTALHDLVSISGSLVIGLAAQMAVFSIENLWEWSRVDELWQIEKWGRDEDAEATVAFKKKAFFHADRFYKLASENQHTKLNSIKFMKKTFFFGKSADSTTLLLTSSL